jgi:hypothetical protein
MQHYAELKIIQFVRILTIYAIYSIIARFSAVYTEENKDC